MLHMVQSSHFLDTRLRHFSIRLVLREIREAWWGSGGPVGSRLHVWRDHVRLARNGMAAMFATVNRNKKSVCLDLKVDEERAIFLDLVRTADALCALGSPRGDRR